MFLASTAHHQAVRYMYVANGTSKMTVSELTVILEVPFVSKLTVILEVAFATYIHLTS
jgi:hypothetical protein